MYQLPFQLLIRQRGYCALIFLLDSLRGECYGGRQHIQRLAPYHDRTEHLPRGHGTTAVNVAGSAVGENDRPGQTGVANVCGRAGVPGIVSDALTG